MQRQWGVLVRNYAEAIRKAGMTHSLQASSKKKSTYLASNACEAEDGCSSRPCSWAALAVPPHRNLQSNQGFMAEDL